MDSETFDGFEATTDVSAVGIDKEILAKMIEGLGAAAKAIGADWSNQEIISQALKLEPFWDDVSELPDFATVVRVLMSQERPDQT